MQMKDFCSDIPENQQQTTASNNLQMMSYQTQLQIRLDCSLVCAEFDCLDKKKCM